MPWVSLTVPRSLSKMGGLTGDHLQPLVGMRALLANWPGLPSGSPGEEE